MSLPVVSRARQLRGYAEVDTCMAANAGSGPRRSSRAGALPVVFALPWVHGHAPRLALTITGSARVPKPAVHVGDGRPTDVAPASDLTPTRKVHVTCTVRV
jgi:hypothetical protein